MKETTQLLDLTKTIAAGLFAGRRYPWEVLEDLSAYILKLGASLPEAEFDHPKPDVWIAKDAEVYPTAWINGPCIIDHGAQVRHCAIVGKHAVVGNSTELKNVVLFDGVQVPHYNYVGDSVLGHRAHMGAGSITSNVKSDRTLVQVRDGDVRIPTGRKKFGAIVADFAEVGCNAVLNPGTIVERGSIVYPVVCVRGVVLERCICKTGGVIVPRRED